ncbi:MULTISPECIES: paraquat-inducible protein A [unclassified Pseudomonas]|uniref:paraquat-inducible protein A n=1 Tax=unclassified Pseudomonas TaxID=196821 RepID=UPI0008386916|nr:MULTISPECIES: paraquat-inducible protein A [unclassified Pseudomonas]QIH08151.1 paraquat-inducible protein A [Pseudomonas sp. BIOMIG1BAC]
MPHPKPTGLPNLPLQDLIACHECDLLMRREPLAAGEKSCCPRCGYELAAHRHQWRRRCFALVLTALLLYIPANFLPIMHLTLLGQTRSDTLWTGVVGLYDSGMQGVAILVLLSSMVIPLLKLLCQLLVLLSLHFRIALRTGMLLYRSYHHLREWGMLEVYLIGILVSIVKLVDIADLSLGIGLACFVALLLTQIWLEMSMSPHQVWDALAEEIDEPAR